MDSQVRPTSEWRSSWRVLLSSTFAMSSGSALQVSTAGLFITSLQGSFHWSRAQIGAGALVHLLSTATNPIAGMLADVFGVRTVAAAGFISLACGFGLLAAMPASLTYYYLALAFISIFGATATSIVLSRPVVASFARMRGTAVGLAMSGAALLMMLTIAATQATIVQGGWRIGYLFLALLPLLVGLPAVLSLSRGAGRAESPPAQQRSEIFRVLRSALADFRFWLMFVAMLTANFGIGGFLGHLPALLSDRHISPQMIGVLVPLLSGSAVFGRLISGVAFDRFWPPAIACAELMLPVAGFTILVQGATSLPLIGAAIFLIGWAQGAEGTVLAYFTPRFFGVRAYSTIFGALAVAISFAVSSGGFLFGAIFDANGSYNAALIASAAGLIVAALCILGTSVGWSPRRSEVAAPLATPADR